jgi:hypothetical protein
MPLVLCLLLNGCSAGSSSKVVSGTRDPDQVRLSIAETAAALSDPKRAEDGVWSLLAQLGIGVYTGRRADYARLGSQRS